MKESTTARRKLRRPGALLASAAVLTGLTASGAFVWNSTNAAFTATTSNPTNNWTAGTLGLSDDDSNTALFTATGLVPSMSPVSKCIVVTYGGNVTSTVKLYATGLTGTLGPYVDLTVQQGSATGGTFAGGCAGFTASPTTLYTGTVSGFAGAATSYTSGAVGSWAPTGATQTMVYKFTYNLDSATPTGMQGATAAVGFTWEAQA